MSSWLDFNEEITMSNINHSRKALRNSYALFILNMGLMLWNIYNLYSGYVHSGWLAGIGIGCSGVSAIWVWLSIWEFRIDIKHDKERLSRIKIIKDDKTINEERDMYESTQATYKRLLEEYKKEMERLRANQKPEPCQSGTVNLDLQHSEPRNCT